MTCRAWTYPSRGLPWDVLEFDEAHLKPTLPPPLPLPKDVPTPEEWLLVKVAFAGLNPGAIFQMTLLPPYIRQRDAVPEMDFSGTVLDVWTPGEQAATYKARFKKGDNIVAMLPAAHAIPTGTGALAEYVRIPARYACLKPEDCSFADAAGIMLPALTAYQLVSESGAKARDRVLVNAASGGIGTMVVQMVRRIVGPTGYVVGVCSGRNADMVRSLGADEVVDYTAHAEISTHLSNNYAERPFNLVIDTLGHQTLYRASPSFLIVGGIYKSVGIKPPTFWVPDFIRAVLQMTLNEWWPTSRWLGGVGRRWEGTSMMNPTLKDRQRVVDMLAKREIALVRDSVWPFEHAKEAYRKLGDGHAAGKVLVKVDTSLSADDC